MAKSSHNDTFGFGVRTTIKDTRRNHYTKSVGRKIAIRKVDSEHSDNDNYTPLKVGLFEMAYHGRRNRTTTQ